MSSARDEIDEAWFVWVASVALDADPAELLGTADIGVLAAVVARVERVADPWEQAAAVLEGVACGNPFRVGNRAVAWLAAAMVLRRAGLAVRWADDDARAVVAAVAGGALSGSALVDRLRGGRRIRVVGRCPSCGRELHVLRHESVAGPMTLVGSSRFELTARCCYEHRAHDRRGRPFAGSIPHDDDRWRPLLSGCPSGTLVVLADDGLVVLVPAGGDEFEMHTRFDVSAGELTGRWDQLADGARVGRVAAAEIRVDVSGRFVDLSTLVGRRALVRT